MLSRLRIPPLILIFFIINLALGAAYILNNLTGAPYQKLTVFLNLDGEKNLPTWYSSIQWFCAAILFGIFASRNFSLSSYRSWLLMVLPLVLLALSLDEVAEIHEWIGKKSDRFLPGKTRANTLFRQTGIWIFVIGVPFLVFINALIFSIRGYFQRAPGSFAKVFMGITIMLIGATGIESISNFVDIKSDIYFLIAFTEEFLEMMGSTIILWGGYELLQRHGFAIRLDRAVPTLPGPRGHNSA